MIAVIFAFITLLLLVGHHEWHLTCENLQQSPKVTCEIFGVPPADRGKHGN